MNQNIENKALYRIRSKGRGFAFSNVDLADLGSDSAIRKLLSRLSTRGTIRRVIRGIYDYPKFSQLLNQNLSPDVDQVAHAIARKNGWKIEISGNTALNLMGLSTQVPGKFVYLNDSRNRAYDIGKQELIFKKARLKDLGFKHDESAILVQALRALNRKEFTAIEREKVRNYFEETVRKKILRDTRYTTTWIYEEIKRVFKES